MVIIASDKMKTIQKYVKYTLAQRGDTIVEVVLCLSILALVLGTSSVLANRNTRTLQTTQENTYALRVAQGQIEYVKSFVATHPDEAIPVNSGTSGAPNSEFCMEKVENNPDDPSDDVIRLTSNLGVCKKQHGGAEYSVHITAVKVGEDESGYDVTAEVKWDTLTGNPGKVSLTYRIYKKFGTGEARESGYVCPPGTSRSEGSTTCVPNSPSIQVAVRKIAPDANNTTPSCSKAASQTKAGSTVRLSGPTVKQQSTGGDSTTLFAGLEPFAQYQAQVIGVPSGYELCPPNTSSQLQARADYLAKAEFKIRPICHTERVFSGYQYVYDWVQKIIRWDPIYNAYWIEKWRRVGGGEPAGDGYYYPMPNGVYGPYSNGLYYYFERADWPGPKNGAYWYNVWEAKWYVEIIGYTPVYEWVYELVNQQEIYTDVNKCPQ